MKKIYAILLVLLLIALGTTAFAADADGQGDLIARNAELASFMDDNGNIFVSGMTTPVNTTKAASIVSIDPYRVIFFADPGNDPTIPDSRLVSLRLGDFSETIITDDASAACAFEDEVYFISKANPSQLKKYGIDTKSTTTAFSSFETMNRIYANQDGVVVSMVDNTGAYIYDSNFNTSTAYNEVLASEIGVFDGFEVFLTDGQALMIKEDGASSSKTIDTSVKNWAVIDDTVYYICGSAGNLSLRSYSVSNALWDNIMLLPLEIEQQLTASNNSLFMLSGVNYTVYTLDTENKALKTFATLPSPSSYALGNGKVLTGYRIEAVSGQLNIYGKLASSNAGAVFNFVDFAGQAVRDQQDFILLSAYPIKEEDTVWDLLQPAKQYTTLRKGSRGDAVSAIQQPLEKKGYYDYHIDGIFGWRTERAIELLQADLGMSVNGIADANLQKIILSNKFDAYDPYRQLARGDRGMRVQAMQQRLRDLGYLADDADAIYGPRTQKAVSLFQSENNLRESGTADANTLKKLFSESANVCSSYIDLQYGDSGYRVRELNNRLKQLYFLEGKVGSTYNSATRAAVIRFQQEIGMKQTGAATVAVQQQLFGKYAPEYSGYITLQRGDDNARVKAMQRRLQELGYYTDSIDGYFGKNTLDAVRKFQHAVNLPVSGIADPITKKEIHSPNAPHYREPVSLGMPVIYLSAYSKYEHDIYQIADTDAVNGSINAGWYAEGPVGSFDIILKDDRGTVYMQNYGLDISRNIISIPVAMLSEERTYTLTVTANPDPSKDGAPTSTSIYFVRIMEEPEPEPEEIGRIGKLIITPVGSDIIRESGVYLIPGENLSFSWSADGSVSGYSYSVSDANDTVIYSSSAIDLTTELTIAKVALAEGTYTLTVYAVPTNGTIEDATVESISFKSYTAPEITPTPTPTVTPEPEVTSEPTPKPFVDPAVNTPVLGLEPCLQIAEREIIVDEATVIAEVYEMAEMNFRLTWDSGETASRYDISILDGSGSVLHSYSTTEKYIDLDASLMTQGVVYTLKVTAYSAADETITDSATLYFALPQPVTMDLPEEEIIPEPVVIGNPAITFDPAVGIARDEYGNEYTQISECESVLISWYAEGNIAGYDILITDAAGGEMSSLNTDSASANLPAGYLTRDEIYTLRVTAISADDASVTTTSYASFMLPTAEKEAAPDYAPAPQHVPEEEESTPAEPEITPEPVIIGNPQIFFDPVSEISAEGVNLIAETESLTINWLAEGNIAGYRVVILDSDGQEATSLDTQDASGTLPTAYLTRGMVYTINITAVAAEDHSVTGFASASFMMPELENIPEEYEYSPEAPEYVPEEPKYIPEEPEYIPEESETAPEPVVIGTPSICISPAASTETGANGETLYLLEETGTIAFDWYAEGNIDGYQVQITDEYGTQLTSNYLYSTTAELPAEHFTAGIVYTLNVTAVASEDQSVTSFASASFRLPEPEYVPEEPEYVPEEPEYVPEEPENVPEEPEYVPEEPEYVPEPVTIGQTMLNLNPALYTEMDENNEIIYHIDISAGMEFAWFAEGNIGGYELRIIDETPEPDVEMLYQFTPENAVYFTAEDLFAYGLAYDTLYRVNVTAIAAEDASVTSTATARFVIVNPETMA